MSILRELLAVGIVILYTDDVILPSNDFAEAITKLNQVLEASSQNGLQINWGKYQILHRRVHFLEYIVQDRTITPSKEKIPAVTEFSELKDNKWVGPQSSARQ